MKAILFTLVTLFSVTAMADQCQLITREEANRAVLLLQKNAVVTDFCEPCINGGAKVSKTTVVKTATVKNVQMSPNSYLSEVTVNGKGIDLAYTFIQVAPNKSVNLAKAIGCSTLDETTVSDSIATKEGKAL